MMNKDTPVCLSRSDPMTRTACVRKLRIPLRSLLAFAIFAAVLVSWAYSAWHQSQTVKWLRMQQCGIVFVKIEPLDLFRRISVLLFGNDGGNLVMRVTLDSDCTYASASKDAEIFHAIENLSMVQLIVIKNRGRVVFPKHFRLKHLRRLAIQATRVDFRGLNSEEPAFPRLNYLELISTELNDDDLNSFASQFSELQTLYLEGERVSGDFLKSARYRETLSALLLEACWLSDGATVHLADYKNLRHLSLSYNPITDESMRIINGLYALESLNLYETRVTCSGIAELNRLDCLKVLEFGSRESTYEPFSVPCDLPPFPSLQTLRIRLYSLKSIVLEKLSQISDLRDLSIIFSEIEETIVHEVGEVGLHNRSIELSGSDVVRDFLQSFKKEP